MTTFEYITSKNEKQKDGDKEMDNDKDQLDQKKRNKDKMINFLPNNNSHGDKDECEGGDGYNANSGKAFMLPKNSNNVDGNKFMLLNIPITRKANQGVRNSTSL